MPPTTTTPTDCRAATHAGSWYSSSARTLSRELDAWLALVPTALDNIGPLPVPGARMIIAPHAGYSYSGAAAAWAYKALDVSKAERIFLLGPAHHQRLSTCALSPFSSLATPLGPLPIDAPTVAALRATGRFATLDPAHDEEEHSLELHLPYIYKVLENTFPSPAAFPPLVPITVGALSSAAEAEYGGILAPYLRAPGAVFILSSDFCHWGQRFGYTYYLPAGAAPGEGAVLRRGGEEAGAPVHEGIRRLDELAMRAVSEGSEAFARVLRQTGNTVCGRHPIAVGLAALEAVRAEEGGEGKEGFVFVRYERSSLCEGVRDSSVSYAAAFAVL
ncbi:MAG: hypothetical protein M1829_000058 [Trizodia sp. TS-e1964]|nr:MAG: hypothetical protein M1829_000058 [Trizodia sp. TS-e1964]